jgi:hypothetical protein
VSLKLKIPTTSQRANITANSYSEADNTIEIVFATEFEVKRCTWDGTEFIEILECTDTAVRMQRINAGANLVDTHNTYSVNTIIGVVERAWIENKECKAVVRLSKREDIKGVVDDIKDGIISNISVGYRIFGATQTDNENEVIQIRVTDWEPTELTICSVPQDYTAGIRSLQNDNSNYYEINVQTTQRTMTPEEIAAAAAEAERTRALNNPTPSAALPAAVPAPVDNSAVISAERNRGIEIRRAVGVANIDDETFTESMITRGLSLDSARAEIFTRMAEGQTNIRGVQPTGGRITVDETDKIRSAMSIAIEHRVNPTVKLEDKALEYRGMSIMEMGRDALERAGVKTRGMDKVDIAQASLNISRRSVGMHSTSDFPIVLGDTIRRSLTREYALQERTFLPWAQRGIAQDFRDMNRVSLGEFSDFKEVKEGGEYEYGTIGEKGEKYRVVKYGKIIAYTWEMMINDDLGAFSRIPRAIANAAARKQSDIVYGILTGNPAMSDNVALFHATHKNLATGAAIGIDSIGLLRKGMRTQKGIDNKDFLNLTPEFMITGPANEQLALQYTSTQFTANTANAQNVWAGLVKPIIEPRITDNSWFFAASPNSVDTIEYAFLEGQGELFTTQREGFEVDGVEIKARMVFGAKALDFRGLAKNPGL